MRGSLRDYGAGLVFVVFGALFAGIALTYNLGTPLRMGPGFFPLLLGCLLIVLGAAIVAEAWLKGDASPIGDVPWRAIALILASIIFFGFSVRRLGIAPALFGAVLLAAFSSRRTTVLRAFLMAAGLSAFCLVIFVKLLRLPVPLFGPWLQF